MLNTSLGARGRTGRFPSNRFQTGNPSVHGRWGWFKLFDIANAGPIDSTRAMNLIDRIQNCIWSSAAMAVKKLALGHVWRCPELWYNISHTCCWMTALHPWTVDKSRDLLVWKRVFDLTNDISQRD